VPRNLQRKTLRRGLYRGAALIRDEARRIVRRRSGALAKQIRVASSRGSGQRGAVAYRVGLTPKGFYGKFLENGHVARGPGGKIKGGEVRRKAARVVLKAEGRFVPPYPFMRPAAQKLGQALSEVGRVVEQAIDSGEVTR
jgi:hypothetical protein